MTTAQAKERLRKYGLSEEEIAGLGRWAMIDMVRCFGGARNLQATLIPNQWPDSSARTLADCMFD